MAQEQVKISQLPPQPTPTTLDKIPVVSGGVTSYELLSSLILLFFNNIPAGTIPGSVFDYVISGGVWSGDAYASTRNASMTAMSVYINNRTIAVNAVVARSFTASRDTYVDLLDNLDGTGTLVYTEVTNNNASPALAANSIRIAIIVTGASNIASAASINQGEEGKLLPIASSAPYMVTDSLGNLICPRDPQRKILGYRQVTSSFTSSSTTTAAEAALSCPAKIPNGRKIRVSLYSRAAVNSSASGYAELSIWDGTVGSGTKIAEASQGSTSANGESPLNASRLTTVAPPSSAFTSKTYNIGKRASVTGTATFNADTTYPAYLMVELM